MNEDGTTEKYVGLQKFGGLASASIAGGEEFDKLVEYLNFANGLNIQKVEETFRDDPEYREARQSILDRPLERPMTTGYTMGAPVTTPGYNQGEKDQDLFDLEDEFRRKKLLELNNELGAQVFNWLPDKLVKDQDFLQDLNEDIFTKNPSLYFNFGTGGANTGNGSLYEKWLAWDVSVAFAEGLVADVAIPLAAGAAWINDPLSVPRLLGMVEGESAIDEAIKLRKDFLELTRGSWDEEKQEFTPGLGTLNMTGAADQWKNGNWSGAISQGASTVSRFIPPVAAVIGATIATGGTMTPMATAAFGSGFGAYLAGMGDYMTNYDQFRNPNDAMIHSLAIFGENFALGMGTFGLLRGQFKNIQALRSSGRILDAEVAAFNMNRGWSGIIRNNFGAGFGLGSAAGTLDGFLRAELHESLHDKKLTSSQYDDFLWNGFWTGGALGIGISGTMNFYQAAAAGSRSKFNRNIMKVIDDAQFDHTNKKLFDSKLQSYEKVSDKNIFIEAHFEFNRIRNQKALENIGMMEGLMVRDIPSFYRKLDIDFQLSKLEHMKDADGGRLFTEEGFGFKKKFEALLKETIAIEDKIKVSLDENPISQSERAVLQRSAMDDIAQNWRDEAFSMDVNINSTRLAYNEGRISKQAYEAEQSRIDKFKSDVDEFNTLKSNLDELLDDLAAAKKNLNSTQKKVDTAEEGADVADLNKQLEANNKSVDGISRRVDGATTRINNLLKRVSKDNPALYNHQKDFSGMRYFDGTTQRITPEKKQAAYIDGLSNPEYGLLGNIWNKLKQGQYRELDAMYRAVEKWEGVTGKKVRGPEDPRGLAETNKGVISEALRKSLDVFSKAKTILDDAGIPEVKSTDSVVSWQDYWIAKQTPSVREQVLAKLNAELVEAQNTGKSKSKIEQIQSKIDNESFGTGMSVEEAAAIVNRAESGKNSSSYILAMEQVQQIAKDTQTSLVDYGLVSNDIVGVWSKKNPFYGPQSGKSFDKKLSDMQADVKGKNITTDLKRIWEKIQGKSKRDVNDPQEDMHIFDEDLDLRSGGGLEAKKFIFRRAGRDEKTSDNMLDNLIIQNFQTHMYGNKNKVLQSLYKIVKDNPVEGGSKQMWEIDNKTPKNGDESVVKVMIDGKPKYIRFADKDIPLGLKSLNVEHSNLLISRLFGGGANLMRKMFTTYSPSFIVPNYVRDVTNAVTTVFAEADLPSGITLDKTVKNIMRTSVDSVGKLYSYGKNPKSSKLTAEDIYYIEEFFEYGGKTGYGSIQELTTQLKELNASLGNASVMQKFSKTIGDSKANPLRMIEKINDSFENATRFAAFREARKLNISPEASAQLAKNISINFNQSGSYKAMGDLYLFWNASIQGTGRLARNLKFKPKNIAGSDATRAWYQRFTRVQGVTGGMVGLGMMLQFYNENMSDINPKTGNSYYDDIPSYEKSRNLIFMTGNKGEYFKFPLPYGVGWFADAGRIASTAIRTGDWAAATEQAATSFSHHWMPAPMGGYGLDMDKLDAGLSMVPSMVRPWAELWADRNYFGSPVFKNPQDLLLEDRGDYTELNESMYLSDNTMLSGLLSDMVSGDDPSNTNAVPWYANPDGIDHILYAYTGTTGKFFFDKVAKTVVDWGELAYDASAKDMDWREFNDRFQMISDSDKEYHNFVYNKNQDVPIYNLTSDAFDKRRKLNVAFENLESIETRKDKNDFSQKEYGVTYEAIRDATKAMNQTESDLKPLSMAKNGLDEVLHQAGSFIEEENRVIVGAQEMNALKDLVQRSDVAGVFMDDVVNSQEAMRILSHYNDPKNRESDKYSSIEIQSAQNVLRNIIQHKLDVTRMVTLRAVVNDITPNAKWKSIYAEF